MLLLKNKKMSKTTRMIIRKCSSFQHRNKILKIQSPFSIFPLKKLTCKIQKMAKKKNGTTLHDESLSPVSTTLLQFSLVESKSTAHRWWSTVLPSTMVQPQDITMTRFLTRQASKASKCTFPNGTTQNRFVLAAASSYQGQSNTPNSEKARTQKGTWHRKSHRL